MFGYDEAHSMLNISVFVYMQVERNWNTENHTGFPKGLHPHPYFL
jgi:hypothetical protein